MSPRIAWVSLVVLVLGAPILALPEALGRAHEWVAPIVAIAVLLLAAGLTRGFSWLIWGVGGLGLAAVIGWSRSAEQLDTLKHFCGLAFGLLAMGTVAVWCRTRQQLTLAATVFLLVGAVSLSVGLRSATPIHGTKALRTNPLATPGIPPPLPLNELHARKTVNPNALGATAMLILPVALAVAFVPALWFRFRGALRLSALLTAAWAAAIVVLTQSRAVWLSAACVLVLLLRRWLHPTLWWLVAGSLLVLPGTLFLFARQHPLVIEAIAVVEAREKVWGDALEAVQSAPAFGIGFDYFRNSGLSMVQIAPDKITGAPHAHNIFLQTALDVGLFGLASYLAIMLFVLRRAVDTAKDDDGDPWVRAVSIGAALSLVSVHVYGLVDAVPLGAKVGIFQWLSCGLILAAWRTRRPSEGT